MFTGLDLLVGILSDSLSHSHPHRLLPPGNHRHASDANTGSCIHGIPVTETSGRLRCPRGTRETELGEHKPGRIKPGRIKRAALSLQNQTQYMFCFLIRPRLYASDGATSCLAQGIHARSEFRVQNFNAMLHTCVCVYIYIYIYVNTLTYVSIIISIISISIYLSISLSLYLSLSLYIYIYIYIDVMFAT